jgi:outer membrane protein assembly factor BamB
VAAGSICTAFGGPAAISSVVIVPCIDGLRAVQAGSNSLNVLWHAQSSITGSPIIAGQTVYALNPNGGTLYALNVASGAIRAQCSVGQANRFASPTYSNGMIFVGTLRGVTAVTVG